MLTCNNITLPDLPHPTYQSLISAGAASDLFSRVFKLRPEGPKFEAEGRERGRGSWRGGTGAASPLPTS